MSGELRRIYLARHGETEWSVARRHTGRTDLPLTARGEDQALRLGERLAGHAFSIVLSSPLARAWRTCELAGFGATAQPEPDLVEWDYGAYEGLTAHAIRTQKPDWELFRDGCPGGESITAVAARADRVLARIALPADGDALLFGSGHILRILAARWLGLDPSAGRYLYLGTATLSVLGFHDGPDDPVIHLWNEAAAPR